MSINLSFVFIEILPTKNTIRDGGSTTLYTDYTIALFNNVFTAILLKLIYAA